MAEVSSLFSILRVITRKEHVLEGFLVKVDRLGTWTHVQ